jgi:hypothetical protein
MNVTSSLGAGLPPPPKPPTAGLGAGLPTSPKPSTEGLPRTEPQPANDTELREAFQDFVGQTFYGQLFKTMRQSVGKPAYFHGGRGEEVFQAQLDQILAERMAESSAESFTGPMYDLFTLQRRA